MHDEILAHRLGLVPFKVDPDFFEKKDPNDNFDGSNCLKFYLKVKCTRKKKYLDMSREELKNLDRKEYLNNHEVLAKDFIWEPIGDQKNKFKDNKPSVLIDNVLLILLEENQEIELEVYLTKNNGDTHTKWSPVATAFYKL